MTSLEQAAADLREAEAKLNAHTPKEVLEKAVTIAKEAVLAAARRPRPTTFTQEEVADAAQAALDAFRGNETEAADCDEPIEAAEDIFEETPIPAVEEPNVAPVESATMQDVINSVKASAETIDATEEVSIEDAQKALA